MQGRSKERRGRSIKRPPSRLGRLLVALRGSVGKRRLDASADPKFQEKVRQLKGNGLSRSEAVEWVQDITGTTCNEEDIRRIEVGGKITPSRSLLGNLLRTYGLSKEEIELVLSDPNLNGLGGANPHLLSAWRMRNLALGEFGPAISEALRVGEFISTWVESEKASPSGFMQDEIVAKIVPGEVDRPPLFEKLAKDALLQNEAKKANGIKGWSDNKTLCLSAVNNGGQPEDELFLRSFTESIADDEEERRSLSLQFQASSYRYNVIAKQEAGAEFRWAALQESRFPIQPVPFLASGVGVCVNVVCDGGRSIVIGQRSEDETFRKNEYDAAVVEGIRPTSDVQDGAIDIHQVVRRALSEELGLSRAKLEGIEGLSTADREIVALEGDTFLKRQVIFEFGCDLEFYQWNFLAFVETPLSFDAIYSAWQKAKDRKENQTIQRIPFDRKSATAFIQEKPIWSSGMACIMRTFDYWDD